MFNKKYDVSSLIYDNQGREIYLISTLTNKHALLKNI